MRYIVELVKTEYRRVRVTAQSPKEAEEAALAVTDEDWVPVAIYDLDEEKNDY